MKSIISSSLLALVVFSTFTVWTGTCSASTDDKTWYLKTTPQETLNHDVDNGVYRFLTVCGFSCQPMGVGWIDSKRCYQAGKTKAIGPIGDALETASFELQKKARVFAQKYNQLLVKFFIENGMRQCPTDESWDAAQSMLNDYLESIGGNNKDGVNRNGVGGIFYPAEKSYDFDVNIEKSSMTKTVYRKICSVISHDLASTLVSINISNASPPHQDTGQLYCQAGKVLSLLPLREQSKKQ